MTYSRPKLKAGDQIAILRPGGVEHGVMETGRTARVRTTLFNSATFPPAPYDHGPNGPLVRPSWCKAEGVFYLRRDDWATSSVKFVSRRAAGLAAMALGALCWVAAIGTAWAHSHYSGIRNPVTGVSCCNDKDCWPVRIDEIEAGRDTWRVNVGGTWYDIPARHVQGSFDQDYHACVWGGKLRCLMVPGGV